MSLKTSVIIILLLTFLFLGKGIWPGQTYYIRDITYLFAPQRMFAAQCLQKGELPLWNHYSNWGMPFLANWQSGTFSVGNLFFYFFDFPAGLKLFLIFSFFLAGLGAYLFSQKFFSSLTALAIAAVFIGGGFLLSKLEFLSSTSVYPWLYFLLLLENVSGLAITIVLAFFGGHQAFFYLLILAFVFKLFFVISKKNFSFLNNFVFSGIAAIFLVAVQLLPTVELFFHSSRRQGLEMEISSAESYRLKQLSGIISPLIPHWLKSKPEKKIFGEKYPWAQTAYLGIIVIGLSVYGFFFAPRKIKYLTVFLIFWGILLALGENSIFYKFCYQYLFIFKLFRYPGSLIIFTITGFLILLGYGLERIKDKRLKFFFLGLIILELLIYCWPAIQETTSDNYFHSTPKVIKLLRRHLTTQRFILSPETELNRKVFLTQYNPWQQIRNFLAGYIALPYRVFSVYSSGEPLIPGRSFYWVDQFYQLSPEKAISLIKKTNIAAMIARQQISQFSGIEKYPIDNGIVYHFNNQRRLIEFTDEQLLKYIVRNNDILIEPENQHSGKLIFYETYYPGWYLYSDGKKKSPEVYKDTFQLYNIGDINFRRTICLMYRPFSFFIGLLVSAFAFLILLQQFIIKIR